MRNPFKRNQEQQPTDPQLAGADTPVKTLDEKFDEAFPRTRLTTSYIEIYASKKGNHHLRIRGGNNKIRFHSENFYSKRNARRAAKLLSEETGLAIVDRSNQ